MPDDFAGEKARWARLMDDKRDLYEDKHRLQMGIEEINDKIDRIDDEKKKIVEVLREKDPDWYENEYEED